MRVCAWGFLPVLVGDQHRLELGRFHAEQRGERSGAYLEALLYICRLLLHLRSVDDRDLTVQAFITREGDEPRHTSNPEALPGVTPGF